MDGNLDHSKRVEKYWEPGLGPCRCEFCELLPMNYRPPANGESDAAASDAEPTTGPQDPYADDERGDAEPPDTDLWEPPFTRR